MLELPVDVFVALVELEPDPTLNDEEVECFFEEDEAGFEPVATLGFLSIFLFGVLLG